LLLAAVAAIGQTAKKPSLRSLAFNQVGRLFNFPQANLLYSALSMFSKILYSGSTILERGSSDSQVLQRYKSQVVQCLDHRDPSIRRRALDVVAALVDETNVESLVPEIMTYLKLADGDFRTQLVAKIFASVQRFAVSDVWNFDTVLKLLKDSGNYVAKDVITAFCKLIATNSDVRQHAISELYKVLQNEVDTQPLIQVASWALGEFQDSPSDIPEILIRILSMPQTIVDTKCYLLTALAKLAVRFKQVPVVHPTLQQFAQHNHLEIQQRAGELLRILDKANISDAILAPIDPGAEEQPKSMADKAQASVDDDGLLDLGTETGKASPQKVEPSEGIFTPQKVDDLVELSVNPAPQPPPEPQGPPGSVEALKTADYVIFFELQQNAVNPRQFAIRSSVFGRGEVPLTQFMIQYGVPQGWGIITQPPSSTVLEPKGGRPILQVMVLENRGPNPLLMVAQISYMYRTQPIKEGGRINPIFG
jgi:hypothetical protein